MENELKNDSVFYDVPLNRLVEHPYQAKIYKPRELDPMFLASIADQGILQPILVASNAIIEEDGELGVSLEREDNRKILMIVSGHTRVRAARSLNFERVPAILKTYETVEQLRADLVLSNIRRPDDEEEKTREFLELKQILCQVAKYRQTTNSSVEREERASRLSRILETLGVDLEESLDSTKIIAEKLGLSEHEQRQKTIIFDDKHQEKRIMKLTELLIGHEVLNQLSDDWEEVRRQVNAGEINDAKAVKKIEELIKAAEKKSPMKEKKEVKQKKEKPKETVFVLLSAIPTLANANELLFDEWNLIENRMSKNYDLLPMPSALSDTGGVYPPVDEGYCYAEAFVYKDAAKVVELMKPASVVAFCGYMEKCPRIAFYATLAESLGKKIVRVI